MEETKDNVAPEWAEWLAQDGDGVWYWHAEQPKPDGETVNGDGYWLSHGDSMIARRGELLGDWRDTLEKRPEQDEFKPFISIEDNQEQDMTQQQEVKQDNGWFERGELPPVGIEIEAWFDDGRECWHKADVIGYSLQEERVLAVSLKGTHDRKLVWVHHFRPIRAERDALVEVLTKVKAQGVDIIGVADAILAEGFSLRDK